MLTCIEKPLEALNFYTNSIMITRDLNYPTARKTFAKTAPSSVLNLVKSVFSASLAY